MPSSAKLFELWNRKVHYYLGLYFLFFLWLFLLTGVLLNHGHWLATHRAGERQETKYAATLSSLASGSDFDRAREVMRQLNVRGEIGWPASQQPGYFAFSVSRPSGADQIRVDPAGNVVSVHHFENSGIAAFRNLHTFSGSRYTDTAQRDWILTTIWVAAMDAVAVGLIVIVLGSYYMWFRLRPKRRLGMFVLGLGLASCALFMRSILGFMRLSGV